MSDITAESIKCCALTLGQFDSKSVDLLVTLFHHQNACSQWISSSNQLKDKFENLLSTKRDDDEGYNDTPLTRIELAIMIHFKEKYFPDTTSDNDNNQLQAKVKLSINDELNLAYCFLLAQIDDRLSKKHLEHLNFLLKSSGPVESLFQIYQKLSLNFVDFFTLLIQCGYLAKELVVAHELIQKFQLFIKRYEDFIIAFEKNYQPISNKGNNCSQFDVGSNQNDAHQIPSLMTKLLSIKLDPIKPPKPVEQPIKTPVPRPIVSQSATRLSSLNVPKKALCVIINIKVFISSRSIDTPKRAGSDIDVDVIKVIFNKLNFTVLEAKIDFKKEHLDKALNDIDDKTNFGDFDCLVMFIMSHGLLHSFFTADHKEVIIRDIVKRYSDSSSTTIWRGKPRLFFIQACRSLAPENVQCSTREEVKQSDLSPQMLIAYSCSATEASKRSPTKGSIFIQMLCIILLRHGHLYHVQNILSWTAKFVSRLDEYVNEQTGKSISIQRPEFIEGEFSQKFRFTNTCLYDEYPSWNNKHRTTLLSSLRIYKEIYDIITNTINSNS